MQTEFRITLRVRYYTVYDNDETVFIILFYFFLLLCVVHRILAVAQNVGILGVAPTIPLLKIGNF